VWFIERAWAACGLMRVTAIKSHGSLHGEQTTQSFCHRSKGDFCLIGPWEISYAHAQFLCSANKDGCRRLKNMQSILFSRKESIGRSCSSFVMDSNFSLVASFVMVGNNGRDRENFSATYEGLKSAISLCGSLRMSEKG